MEVRYILGITVVTVSVIKLLVLIFDYTHLYSLAMEIYCFIK